MRSMAGLCADPPGELWRSLAGIDAARCYMCSVVSTCVCVRTESAVSSALRRHDPHPRDTQGSRLRQRAPAHCRQEPAGRCRVHLVAVSDGSRRLAIPAQTGAEMYAATHTHTHTHTHSRLAALCPGLPR